MSTRILAFAAIALGSGFSSVNFDGDNRLRIDISAADSYQNRPGAFQSNFYNTQGKQRAANNASPWEVSGDLYISNDMLSGQNLRRTDLWARDNNPVENNSKYPIFGVIRNDGVGDPFDPSGTLTTRWRVWDDETANGWVDLGDAVTAGWHHLSIAATGTAFEYRLDDNLVYTDSTASQAGFEALQTVFVEAYSFGDVTHATTDNYSVYWDNITAGPVPEPASMTVLGLGALALIRRRRQAKK
jgi:MYXO-CTERM domain-containing protein